MEYEEHSEVTITKNLPNKTGWKRYISGIK